MLEKKKPRDLDKTAAVRKQGAFNNERCVQFLKDATYEIMCYRELITCEKEPLRGLTETADNVQMILKTAQQMPNTSRSVRIDNIRALWNGTSSLTCQDVLGLELQTLKEAATEMEHIRSQLPLKDVCSVPQPSDCVMKETTVLSCFAIEVLRVAD